jgi:iron complex outermembrane recepter protein
MSKMRLVGSTSSVLLAAVVGLGAGAAQAQTAATPSAAPNDAFSVEEVVVTAQRREERQVNVPISVAVFSPLQLARTNVTSSADLQVLTPGLRMDQTGVFTVPTIRGVGTPVTGTAASPTAIYVDGVYQPNPASNTFDLINVGSIQVLKGPQGTLFGRNSEGGAILVSTLDPTDTPHARGQIDYGNFNERKANLFVSGPLGRPNLSGNLSIYGRHNDNYLTNIATGSKKVAPIDIFTIAGKLRWTPSDNASFVLKVQHANISDPSGHNYTAAIDPATGRGYASANGRPGGIVGRPPFDVSENLLPKNRIIQNSVTLKSVFDMDWATLTSYSSWIQERDRSRVDQDASNLPISEFILGNMETDWQQEINLAHNGEGPLDWVLGLYYADSKAKSPGLFAITSATSIVNAGAPLNRGKAYAVYGDATYNFAPQWYVTLGGRYSVEDKSVIVLAGGPLANQNVLLDQTWRAFTPRAVLRYQITPNSNIYVSYSKGQKSGLFNTTIRLLPVEPETLSAFEVGFKTQAARWHFETAAFHYDYKNLQFQNTVAGIGSITSNAGTAKSYGGEASLTYQLTDELSAVLSGAYTHARYTSFRGAVIAIPRADDLGNTIVTQDVSGRTMIRAPEWTGSASANWRHPMRNGIIELSGNLYYTSRIFFQADNAKIYSQKPYALLNLRAAWSPLSEKYQVAIWGKNVMDVHYMNQASPDAAAARVRYSAPATYGVSVSFNY